MSYSFPPQPIKTDRLFASHRAKSLVYIAIFFILIAAAIVWEVLRVIAPPFLEIKNPPDNLLTKETSVVVSGRAAPDSTVTINNEFTATDLNGNFDETLDLRTGLNVITISASKKFAKPNTIYRSVVVTK
jgi:Glucodextranase, domain B